MKELAREYGDFYTGPMPAEWPAVVELMREKFEERGKPWPFGDDPPQVVWDKLCRGELPEPGGRYVELVGKKIVELLRERALSASREEKP